MILQSNAAAGFDLMLAFDQASPKLENGSAIADAIHWEHDNLVSGMLRGLDALDGLNLNITRRPTDGLMTTQVAFIANGKNDNFGSSGWFYAIEQDAVCTSQYCSCFEAGGHRKGDWNVDLTEVPLPASGLLLLTGLLGIGGHAAAPQTLTDLTQTLLAPPQWVASFRCGHLGPPL